MLLPTRGSPQVHPDTRFGVRVRNKAEQTITTDVLTTLSWDVVDYNRGLMFQLHRDQQRLICRIPGVFHGVASISWVAEATGYRRVDVTIDRPDSTNDIAGSNTVTAVSGIRTQQNCVWHGEFRIGDTLLVKVAHSRGSDLNIQASSTGTPVLEATYVRPLEPRIS